MSWEPDSDHEDLVAFGVGACGFVAFMALWWHLTLALAGALGWTMTTLVGAGLGSWLAIWGVIRTGTAIWKKLRTKREADHDQHRP